ncbi:hypothetical protein DFQ27_003055, partial [Actinomortierella ambigua]
SGRQGRPQPLQCSIPDASGGHYYNQRQLCRQNRRQCQRCALPCPDQRRLHASIQFGGRERR